MDHEFYSHVDRDWASKPLKIGMFGALTYRKGIDLGIDSFLDLFEDDPSVELHLATSTFDLPQFHYLPQAHANIFVEHIGWHTREHVRDWYRDKHALLAPFRGEGYYLPGVEMMATGGVLIAPNQMGAESYHTTNTGYVIPAEYGPVLHGVATTEPKLPHVTVSG